MKNYEIYFNTWPDIEEYLKTSKSLILPVGSTEQHGPTGLIGTDFLSAWEIAKAVGSQTKTLVASPITYGMALHHMAFPGSASLKPSTYVQVILEIIESYIHHGFKEIFVINGHGGNIAPITTAFCEVQGNHQGVELELFNWWRLESCANYEKKVFGEKNGFHATCGETSACIALFPHVPQDQSKLKYFENPSEHPWPMNAIDFRKSFPDGRMNSDPRLATAEHGHQILKLVIDEISQTITKS